MTMIHEPTRPGGAQIQAGGTGIDDMHVLYMKANKRQYATIGSQGHNQRKDRKGLLPAKRNGISSIITERVSHFPYHFRNSWEW